LFEGSYIRVVLSKETRLLSEMEIHGPNKLANG